MEECFPDDANGRILAIVEALKIGNVKTHNIVENQGKGLVWKEQAVNYAVVIFN